MTALAADIGTGNIVGVSTAIYIGGPGALFWMWVTALVGMATKFSEVLLSVHFREKTPAGNWVGGAMYFIKNGLGPKWMWLGSCFALFGIVACIGTGAMVQGNSIGEAMQANLSIPTWFTAVAVFLLAGAVLIGGVKRIGAVAGKVVPAMAVIYVIISLIVIILHIDQLPRVLAWVVAEAFTPTAAEGGFAGDRMFVKLKELGGETPLVVNRIMYTLYKKNKRDIRHIGCKKYGIQTLLKGLYINNDLLYLHTSLRNASDISFDIDHIRFKVVDKKVAKRTAMQENFIEPVRTYNRLTTVDGKATVRNIFVLPKLTLPDDKLLVVEIYEKGGARHQSFRIENTDLVAAKPVSELHLK